MEEGHVAHNCAVSPVEIAVMSHSQAQTTLAHLIDKLSKTTVCCWWQLLGGDANSLCKLLDVPWSSLRLILRKCRVLCGSADSFRTSAFEEFMLLVKRDYTMCRPCGKLVYFLKIGDSIDDAHAIERPKDMHSAGGILEVMPILGVHIPGVCTKVSRRLASSLMEATTEAFVDGITEEKHHYSNQSNKGSMTIYINDFIDVVKKEIMCASRQGGAYTFTQRAERMLRKAAAVAIKGSLRDIVDAWVERIGDESKDGKEAAMECLSTPALGGQRTDITTSDLVEITRRPFFEDNTPTLDEQGNIPLITPPIDPIDLSDDVDVDERDIDIVLTQLKEETMLQNLLHKRLTSKSERVLMLEHKNGRKCRVVVPPDSHTSKRFVEEAKKSRWINDMLYNEQHRKGMLLHLAQTHPATHQRVANQKKITTQSAVLNAPQTIALGRLAGINDTQMTKMRSFLKNVGKAELKMSKKEIRRIDADVGLNSTMPEVHFNTYTLEWATTSGKSAEKKAPETCPYWNSNLLLEVAAEIDLVLASLFLEKPEDNNTLRVLDYRAPDFDDNRPGIVVLFGGDHGAGACPCSMKLNFSSPEKRKERGELNCRCPTIQIASIDCSKDSFELLSNTVMPRLRQQLIDLRNSCAVVVHCDKELRKHRKAFLMPKNFNRNSIHIQNQRLAYHVGGAERTIELGDFFDATLLLGSFRVTVVISNFHDLYVGDLAFLCMAVGMNNSDGAHCVHCTLKAREFNCPQMQAEWIRTKASLTPCLNEHNRQRLRRKAVQNYKGVNCIGLLDIDPQRIIVPMLHCPMGLVDKALMHFKAWVIYEVENLPDGPNQIRQTYRNAVALVAVAEEEEEVARQQDEQAGHAPETMSALKGKKDARIAASKEETKAKGNFDEMVKRHNSRLFSLSQSFDVIFRSHNIKKEHHHGGKCNGVNCMRIMEKSQELFQEFSTASKNKKMPTKTDAEIETRCREFARMFGLLDAIWSNVRGIDAGLLPTDEQVQQLRTATLNAKQLWCTMNIGTLQPKWHLTFDGHLVDQVRKHGGLADKADDTIEFQHQTLMKLRDRYRSVRSFRTKETCTRRELRRRKSPEIQSHVDSYEASIKRKKNSKRALDATERQHQQRKAKKVKREAAIDG